MEESASARPAGKKRRGWFKTSCLGCLGIFFILLVLVAGWVGVNLLLGSPDSDPQSSRLATPLAGSGERLAPGDELSGLPNLPPSMPRRPGRVILDISMANFEILPGPAGEPLRVEADYDAGAFELREDYEPGGETGWTYRLTFDNKVSMFRQLLGGIEAENNRVRLILPRDTPIDLSGSIGIGQSEAELGGLWLTSVNVKLGVGEHMVRFSEPLAQPAETVSFIGSLGETTVRGLGNASPRLLTLRHFIGEVDYDLRGAWQRDADVSIRCSIGECSVRLPGDEVQVNLNHVGLTIGESKVADLSSRETPPPGAPVLNMTVTSSLGELDISD